MTSQFPHYRVVARQKEGQDDCSLRSILSLPSTLFFFGILLGFLLSKSCCHRK